MPTGSLRSVSGYTAKSFFCRLLCLAISPALLCSAFGCVPLRARAPAARGRWSMVVRSRSSRPTNRLSIEEALGLRDDPGVEFVAVGLVRACCRLQSLHEVVLLQVIDVVDADVDVRRVQRFFDRALVRAHLRFAHGRGGRGHELDEHVLGSL